MAAYLRRPAQTITPAAFGIMAAACGAALAVSAPSSLGVVLGLTSIAALALFAFDFPVSATAAWLLLAGSTPEYWLADAAGGAGALIAAEKFAAFGLVAISGIRFGFRLDPFNPAHAFGFIFAAGFLHGLHPRLEAIESLRSLAGSVAPFAFGFVRFPQDWARAVIRCVCLLPLLLVCAGAALAAAGLHPMFVDQSGMRLQATGIPAFLGGFSETAVFAGLLETMRGGRPRDAGLLCLNLAILLLSGARTPLAVNAAIGCLALLFVRSSRLPPRRRLPAILAAGLAVPLAVAAAGTMTEIRLFNVLSGDAAGMSGRDLLWPQFSRAWEEQPLWGQGLGAAKVVIPPDSAIAHLTGTTAPHNEYLRLGVEGGWVGLALLLACFAAWTWSRTRRLARVDRIMLRLTMVGIAVHAATDNLLISTTSGVLFAWMVAAFVRGAEAAGTEMGVARRGHSSA